MQKAIKTVIVDDNTFLIKAIQEKLSFFDDIQIKFTALDGSDLLTKISNNHNIDVILMDIDMPLMNGLEATRRALTLIPDLKIMAFTMFGDKEYNDKIRELGAKGFVSKTVDIEELELAIETILNGHNYFQNTELVNSISI